MEMIFLISNNLKDFRQLKKCSGGPVVQDTTFYSQFAEPLTLLTPERR